MLLKRSGRGHEPEGIEETKPGQCAVECPVCPHPGRNVPLNWHEAPENSKYSVFFILSAFDVDCHQMEVPVNISY
jgi:hypothetical protein